MSANQLFYLIRIYPNGEAKHSLRDEEGKNSWLEYNKRFRGNTLFVDGECVYRGVLKEEIIPILEKQVKELPPHNLPQDKHGPQVEVWGLSCFHDEWMGYPPERQMYPIIKFHF